MKGDDLLADLAHGEDSRRQFKRDVPNADALAAEMCAFANTAGAAPLKPPINPMSRNVMT